MLTKRRAVVPKVAFEESYSLIPLGIKMDERWKRWSDYCHDRGGLERLLAGVEVNAD